MLKSIGLLVIAVLAGSGAGHRHLRRTHPGAHAIPGERSAGRPRSRARAAATLATEYIATQLALAGAKPAGDNGTYYQKVPLVGIETQPDATLGAAVWGKGLDLRGATISWATARRSGPTRASKARRSSWATASPRRSSNGTISKASM